MNHLPEKLHVSILLGASQRYEVRNLITVTAMVLELGKGLRGRTCIIPHPIGTRDVRSTCQNPWRFLLSGKRQRRLSRKWRVMVLSNLTKSVDLTHCLSKELRWHFQVLLGLLDIKCHLYSLPQIDETLDSLLGCESFLMLDLKSVIVWSD